MPSMGDLVTNLVIDSTRFVSGVDRARDSNIALSGSVNSIIGQLSRQQKAFETAGRSTLDWIEADKKASEETKELAKSLLLQVESLNKVAAARKSMAAQSALFAPLTKPDHFGRGLSRLETQRDIDAKNSQLAAERDANDPFTQGMAGWQKTNDSFQRGLRQMAVDYGHLQQQITSAATAQERFNAATTHANSARASVTNVQRLADANAATRAQKQADYDRLFGAVTESDSERDARDPFLQGMAQHNANNGGNDPFQRGLRVMGDDNTKRQADAEARRAAGVAGDAWREEDQAERDRIDAIRRRGLDAANARRAAADEERRAVLATRETSRQTAQNRRDDANVQRQLREQGYGGRNRPAHQNEERRDNRRWAGVELFRAGEDFMQGSATGGLKGGILAASNNVSQMGAAFGAQGAMIGSLVSGVTLLGVSLTDMWLKSGEGARKNAEATEQFVETLGKAISQSQSLLSIEQQRRRVTDMDLGGATSAAQSMQDQIERYDHDIKFAEEYGNKLKDRVGAGGISADELQQWRDEQAFRREDIGGRVDPLSGMSSPGRDATAWEKRMMNVKPEALTDAFIKTQRELEESRSREIAIRDKLQNTLQKENEENRKRLQRNEDADAEAEMERGAERRRAHERGGRGPLTDWEKIDDRRGRNNEQNAKEKQKFESGQAWYQNRKEQSMLEGMESDKDRVSYQVLKEHGETKRRSAEALRMGIITKEEKWDLDQQAGLDGENKIRKAKYGDLQADGQSGFGSQDARTTGGMNAIVKAVRYSEQDKTIAELKKNGDITQEVATAINNLATIMQTAPVPVVTF